MMSLLLSEGKDWYFPPCADFTITVTIWIEEWKMTYYCYVFAEQMMKRIMCVTLAHTRANTHTYSHAQTRTMKYFLIKHYLLLNGWVFQGIIDPVFPLAFETAIPVGLTTLKITCPLQFLSVNSFNIILNICSTAKIYRYFTGTDTHMNYQSRAIFTGLKLVITGKRL